LKFLFPGGEHAITSDDIFSWNKVPGKTLVIGASYVALECAGFLHGLGFGTTLLVRSIFLRGFDQQMADLVGANLEKHGVLVVRPAIPVSIEKLENGKLRVTWKGTTSEDHTEGTDDFDTVLTAIGRAPETKKIGIDRLGIITDPATGKIVTTNERTNIPHIYAIGDIIKGGLELTPVAIHAGRLLVRRLYSKSTLAMSYIGVPTTVFTPLEYGCCGLSEEDANSKYGPDDIEVYHTNFTPLEWTVPHLESNACYVKLICLKSENERVVGFHILGPNAGEITQAVALGLRLKATKHDFDETVGIHPTIAEEMTTLSVTKSSGSSSGKGAC